MTIEAEAQARERAVWLDRRTPPHVVTLVLMTGVPALNMNMMIPSLPSLAGHYGADYGIVALSISGYLALTAVLQLVFGPLSDRFGRRPVVLGCFLVFLVATLGTMAAPSIGLFLLCRMLQAPVSAGLTLSRAIVRDMVPPEEAASMIGYVTMGMALIPMVVPMLGGFLDQLFGWQSVFAFTFVFGLAVTALLWADLGETNRTPSSSMMAQVAAYPELLRSPTFWGFSATAALGSGTFFAFLGGGPWVATHVLGMSPAAFGFYFGFISAGYVARQLPLRALRAALRARGHDARRGPGGDGRRRFSGSVSSRPASSPRSPSSGRSSSSGSATACCCRAPTPASSRCSRTSPARPPASAARCSSAAARRCRSSAAPCSARAPAPGRCSG